MKKGKLYRAAKSFEAQGKINIASGGDVIDVGVDTLFTVISIHTCITFMMIKKPGVRILTQDGTLCYVWSDDMRKCYEEL